MKQFYFLLPALLFFNLFGLAGQTNITVTNPEVYDILKGNFAADDYAPSVVINRHEDIIDGLLADVSADSLKQYLMELAIFENRNTGSDTLSETFGMGAARRWAYGKMEAFSARRENRLRVSYLQFDEDICGMGQHRNVFAVLPGAGPHRNEMVLVEGHMDSRCEDVCDTECMAHGIDDNGSGTALVLEMARVMSRFTFDRTLIFLITTGEEQGLFGADAFAEFCETEDISIRGVYNNDIVGGIICGQTASPPGCPGLNDIDSINVRIYSSIGSRMLARFAHLEYEEELATLMPVRTVINLISREDRIGRGGDHIPFRERGFDAIRFTSANEHGDGNPSAAGYDDRQHTVEDLLGVDTDGDNVIDSFFVDFNYLARNAIINGNSICMSALGPVTPERFLIESLDIGFRYEITDPLDIGRYRIGIRDLASTYFDTLLEVTNKIDTITFLEDRNFFYFTAASVDSNNIESHFTPEIREFFISDVEDNPYLSKGGITLLQNRPNPFDEATTIGIQIDRPVNYGEAFVRVTDVQGKELVRYDVELKPGFVELLYGYEHHRYQPGTYYYSLVIDGQVYDTKAMVYAY